MRLASPTKIEVPPIGGWLTPSGQFLPAALSDFHALVPRSPDEIVYSIVQKLQSLEEEIHAIEGDPQFKTDDPHDESLEGAIQVATLKTHAEIADDLFAHGYLRVDPASKGKPAVLVQGKNHQALREMPTPFADPVQTAQTTGRKLVGYDDLPGPSRTAPSIE